AWRRAVVRVALATRSIERGHTHASGYRDGTAHLGAAHGRLTAVGRVAQRETRQLHARTNHPVLDLQARGRNAVTEPGDLAIEPRQLAPAHHVDEPGPGLTIQRRGPYGVALPGPVRLGCPRTLGEPEELRHHHVVEPPVASQCLGPQVALDPNDVGPAVVGETIFAGEHGVGTGVAV